MKSGLFLPGIAPAVARSAHAFAVRFLEPLVHFVLILIKAVAAKDIPPRKRSRARFPAMLEDDGVSQVDDGVSVPGDGECVGKVLYPRWARDPIAVTQELNRGRAKGSSLAGMLRVRFRLPQRLAD